MKPRYSLLGQEDLQHLNAECEAKEERHQGKERDVAKVMQVQVEQEHDYECEPALP